MISTWESYLFHFIISWVNRHKSQIYYVWSMQQKNIQVYWFLYIRRNEWLEHIGGGGGSRNYFWYIWWGHEIFWRQYNWVTRKTGILEERLRPGLTCTLWVLPKLEWDGELPEPLLNDWFEFFCEAIWHFSLCKAQECEWTTHACILFGRIQWSIRRMCILKMRIIRWDF